MEPSSPTFWTRDHVAERLTVSTTTLLRWEARGFVRAVRSGRDEGYGPAEIRRLWTILTFRRDLGINLAGVEVILRLLDQMQATHARLDHLAGALRSTLDEPDPADDADA